MTWSSSSTNKSGGQYLELLCSELQEGTAVIDQSTGMVVCCNPAWLSMFGGTNALAIQGTGLGLHIVSKYAELMNGTIACKSSLNQGITFTLSFTLNQTHHEKNPAD